MLMLLVFVATGTNAQIGNLGSRIMKRAKSKVERTTKSAIDIATDKAVENAEGKIEDATKKKAKKAAKKVAGDKAAEVVSGDDASGDDSPTDAASAFKAGKFRAIPNPPIDIKTLDAATKDVMDANDGVTLDNWNDKMTDDQLLVVGTLFFRQQLKNLNAGNFDDVAKTMLDYDNIGIQLWRIFNSRKVKTDGGSYINDPNCYLIQTRMRDLNYYFAESMFVGLPYNAAASKYGYQYNERAHQVRLALFGNLEVPFFTKQLYYQMYDYFLTLAEKEKQSEECKKLYVSYAVSWRLKAADPAKFTDENVEESDAEWQALEKRMAAFMKSWNGSDLETLAQLKAEKKESKAKAAAAAAAKEKEYWTSQIPKGINDPTTEAQFKKVAQSYYGSNRTVVKVIVESKDWHIRTTPLNKIINRSKQCTVITKTSDGKYYMQTCDVIQSYNGGKYSSPRLDVRSFGDNQTGYEINWK